MMGDVSLNSIRQSLALSDHEFDDQAFRDIATALESYFSELTDWQRVQNLVSRETLNEFWIRHAQDSLQVLSLLNKDQVHILDIGSGGGLPSIPLAIAMRAFQTKFTLIEANQRKCSFLRHVARKLDLSVKVEAMRAEQLARANIEPVGIFTSRATADLSEILAYCAPIWQSDSKALLHKGRNFRAEIDAACAHWRFDVVIHNSQTQSDAAILEISHLARL